MFTAASSNLAAPATNEIMVWTTTHYMVPVTNKDASGNIVYLATNLNLAGYTWYAFKTDYEYYAELRGPGTYILAREIYQSIRE